MLIRIHDDQFVHSVPRIKTRVIVGAGSGAESTAVWEQWIHAAGYIPPHYHEEEEILVILSGAVIYSQDGEDATVEAPATIVVPERAIHAVRPAGDHEVHLLAFFPVAEPRIFAPDGHPRPLPWEDHTELE